MVFEKRTVFKEDLKEPTEVAWRTEEGSWFQTAGAQEEKDCWPLDWRVLWTCTTTLCSSIHVLLLSMDTTHLFLQLHQLLLIMKITITAINIPVSSAPSGTVIELHQVLLIIMITITAVSTPVPSAPSAAVNYEDYYNCYQHTCLFSSIRYC